MGSEKLKKLLAGLSIASLLSGPGVMVSTAAEGGSG